MTTLYQLLAADRALNLLFQRNSVLSCTHGGYAYVLSSIDLVLLDSLSSSLCFNWMLQQNEILKTTTFTGDNYANSQDFEILVQYSNGEGSSWKGQRNILTRRKLRSRYVKNARNPHVRSP